MPVELPAFLEVLGPLIQLCGLIVALSAIVVLAWVVKNFLEAIASWLSFLPGIGGVAASVVTSVEQAISNGLGHAISGIESMIGKTWHNFARVLHMLWAEQKLVAANLWHLAQGFYHAVPLSDFTKLLHRFESHVTQITRTITRDITKEVHTTVAKVEQLGHHVLPRLRHAEHAIAVTIPREFGGLWGETKALEDSIGRLWDRVRSLPTTTDIAAAVTAAIAALGLVGLDLIKCAESGNLFNKRGCGLWTLLDDALGLIFDLTVVATICEVIPLLEEAFSVIASPLISTVSAAGAGLCSPGSARAPQLAVPTLDLPPSPGDTLYLP